jgi:hypothetical protein
VRTVRGEEEMFLVPIYEDVKVQELGRLPTGYVLCNDESILEVVCEDCRMRYYAELRVYDSLDEAGDE